MSIEHTEKNIKILKSNFYSELDKVFVNNENINWNMDNFNQFFNAYLNSLLKTEFEIFMNNQEDENYKNGYSLKTIKTIHGEIDIKVPRDRNGKFNSDILTKYSSSTEELSRVIIKLFQLGLSHNDVCTFLKDIYEVKYSKTSIASLVSVCDETVEEFNKRKLNSNYVALFIDATYIPIKFDSHYEKQGLHLIVGINEYGYQEIISYVIGFSENLTLWQEVLDDIKARGVKNVDVIVSDGFVGLEQIIKPRFPEAKIQRCTVHILRNVIHKVAQKDTPAIIADISNLFKFTDRESFNTQLSYLKLKYSKYEDVLNGTFADPNIMTYLDFPTKMHRTIKTTNRIEAVNQKIKTRIKFKQNFPNQKSFERTLVSSIIQQNNQSNKPVGGLIDYISKKKNVS